MQGIEVSLNRLMARHDGLIQTVVRQQLMMMHHSSKHWTRL